MQGVQHVSGHQHGGREVEAVGGDHAVASTAAPRHSASCDRVWQAGLASIIESTFLLPRTMVMVHCYSVLHLLCTAPTR